MILEELPMLLGQLLTKSHIISSLLKTRGYFNITAILQQYHILISICPIFTSSYYPNITLSQHLSNIRFSHSLIGSYFYSIVVNNPISGLLISYLLLNDINFNIRQCDWNDSKSKPLTKVFFMFWKFFLYYVYYYNNLILF